MTSLPRVIFDTSTLVSAAIRARSVPGQALTKAFDLCSVCATIPILEELFEVLARNKFDRYLGTDARRDFLSTVVRKVQLFGVDPGEQLLTEPPCRDAKDRKFLELALICDAEVLVSSDFDLLVLNPWRGVPVLSPSEFMALRI